MYLDIPPDTGMISVRVTHTPIDHNILSSNSYGFSSRDWQDVLRFPCTEFFVIVMAFPHFSTEQARVSFLFEANAPEQENK